MATGEYVAFLDADDWLGKDFFSDDIVDELRRGFDLYQFTYTAITNLLKYKKCFYAYDEEIQYDTNGFGRYNWYSFFSIIYKRELLEENEIRFFNCKLNEDRTFAERAFYCSKTIRKINKNIYNYWSNQSSATHTMNYEKFFNENYKAFTLTRDWFFEKFNESQNVEYSVLMLFSDIVREVCLKNSFKNAKEYFNDERFLPIKRYKEFSLHTKRLKNILRDWDERPRMVWLKSKFIYGTTKLFVNLLYKCKILRGFLEYLNYKIRRKYKCIDNDDLWVIEKH